MRLHEKDSAKKLLYSGQLKKSVDVHPYINALLTHYMVARKRMSSSHKNG